MGFGRPRGIVPGKSNLAGGELYIRAPGCPDYLGENIKDAEALWNAGARFGGVSSFGGVEKTPPCGEG